MTFLWKGSGLPGVQFYEALDGYAHEGQSTLVEIVLPAHHRARSPPTATDSRSQASRSTSTTSSTTLIASRFTELDGTYRFENLPPGQLHGERRHSRSATPSLATTSSSPVSRSTCALECLAIEYYPRTIGFWKHQVSVHSAGRARPRSPS